MKEKALYDIDQHLGNYEEGEDSWRAAVWKTINLCGR